MPEDAKLTGSYVVQQIRRLGAQEGSAGKASLARLRRGIGRAPGSMPELWEITLKGLPEGLLSRDGRPTRGEWAVHTALTLYALHQQGRDPAKDSMHAQGVGLGAAVGRLVKKEEEDLPRVKRRFDAAVTSDSLAEFAHHLRGLVQLLRAEGFPMDYALLSQDLFWFQFTGARDRVRLRWGQDFYRKAGKGTDASPAEEKEEKKDGAQDD